MIFFGKNVFHSNLKKGIRVSWVRLVKESLVPDLKRIYVFYEPDYRSSKIQIKLFEEVKYLSHFFFTWTKQRALSFCLNQRCDFYCALPKLKKTKLYSDIIVK